MQTDRELAFPRSVLDLLGGRMGQVDGGFPRMSATAFCEAKSRSKAGPARRIPPADLKPRPEKVAKMIEGEPTRTGRRPYLMYPQVFEQFAQHHELYGDTERACRRPSFFYGMEPGEEIAVDIEPGKTLIIKFLTVGEPQPTAHGRVFFELNGQPREVTVTDQSL